MGSGVSVASRLEGIQESWNGSTSVLSSERAAWKQVLWPSTTKQREAHRGSNIIATREDRQSWHEADSRETRKTKS